MPDTPTIDRDGLEDLLRNHYAALQRLALVVLESEPAAQAAARLAFARAATGAADYRGRSDSLWLYELGWASIRSQPQPAAPQAGTRAAWLVWAATLNREERLLLGLYYVLGWTPANAARLLHAGQGAVQAQLGVFRRQLRRALSLKEAGDPALDRQIAALLQAHWPVAALEPEQLGPLAEAILEQAASGAAAPAPSSNRRMFVLVALGLSAILALLVIGAGMLVWRQATQATPVALPPGMPTPVTPAPRPRPLTSRSSGDQIRDRMQASAGLWRTLWIDVQSYDYGPPSYRGAPRLYRSQAWISQPGESLEFTGLLSRHPSQAAMVLKGRRYTFNTMLGKAGVEGWDGPLEALLTPGRLQSMVFPATAAWSQAGRLEPAGTEEDIAGRKAVVADWYDAGGARAARLWIDAETGLALRWQAFDPANAGLLLADSAVTGMAYDANYPPGQLLEGLNLDENPLRQASPGGQILAQAPNLTLPLVERPRLPAEQPAPNFNPSGARLIFQFAPELQPANVISATGRAPVAFFADGYLLGSGEFGLPWMLRCARSPDGERIAFSTGSDGAALPDAELRWLNLSEPQRAYRPLPGLEAVDFAFSPDSRQLAAFARRGDQAADGLYLVDIGTGQQRLLLPLAEASSLTWSPDGETLALVGKLPADPQSRLLVVHVRTGQQVFSAAYDPATDELPENWPGKDWPWPFPHSMGGLEACAVPVQQ